MALSGGGSRARKRARRAEDEGAAHRRELFRRRQARMNTPRVLRPATSITEVKRRAEACGSYFFEPGTMRFFKSRILSDVYAGASPKITFFVTSERGPHGPRLYTVRKQVGCEIKTVGEFQGFKSASAAKRAALRLASGRR